jgi:hypothetical protein
MHARQRGLEAADLVANDLGIDQQEGLVVALLQRIPDVAELQPDFGMRVKEVGIGVGCSRGFLEGDGAHGHQRSP